MPSAREIVDIFGYASLAKALGCPAGTVSAWKTRNAIPHAYWRAIEAEARRRRLRQITYAALEAALPPRRKRTCRTQLEARP